MSTINSSSEWRSHSQSTIKRDVTIKDVKEMGKAKKTRVFCDTCVSDATRKKEPPMFLKKSALIMRNGETCETKLSKGDVVNMEYVKVEEKGKFVYKIIGANIVGKTYKPKIEVNVKALL